MDFTRENTKSANQRSDFDDLQHELVGRYVGKIAGFALGPCGPMSFGKGQGGFDDLASQDSFMLKAVRDG